MIQWYLLGMFAPSAPSALFLKRHGIFKTNITAGLVMTSGSVLGTFADTGWAMTATLTLVGVGWNVFFVAGSALLLQSYPQGRGAGIQGFTDGTTAAISATGYLAAAWLLQSLGWAGINILALTTTTTVLLLLAWSTNRMGKKPLPRHDPDETSALVVAERPALERSSRD